MYDWALFLNKVRAAKFNEVPRQNELYEQVRARHAGSRVRGRKRRKRLGKGSSGRPHAGEANEPKFIRLVPNSVLRGLLGDA